MLGYTPLGPEAETPRADPPARQPLGRHPPRQTPPWVDTPSPWADTPMGRQPPGRHPPRQTPPWADTPCTVHAGIRSKSGRYASHWNAFLFDLCLHAWFSHFQTDKIPSFFQYFFPFSSIILVLCF